MRRARKLEAEYRKDRAQNIFYDESQKLADQAFASLTELDSVAKAMNLPVKTVTGFTREGGGEFGQDPASSRRRSAMTCSSAARTARW